MKDALADSVRLAERSERLESSVRTLEQSLAAVALRESHWRRSTASTRELEHEVVCLPAVLDVDAIAAHPSALSEAPLQLHPFPQSSWTTCGRSRSTTLVEGHPASELFGTGPSTRDGWSCPSSGRTSTAARVELLVRRCWIGWWPPCWGGSQGPLGEWLLANWPLRLSANRERALPEHRRRILLRHRGYLFHRTAIRSGPDHVSDVPGQTATARPGARSS